MWSRYRRHSAPKLILGRREEMAISKFYWKWAHVGVIVIAAVALSVAANAAVVAEKTTSLTGTGLVKTLSCHAVVDKTGSVFTYTYDLTYVLGSESVHTYKVQNPSLVPFYGADNSPYGEPREFTDPADGNGAWVSWLQGNLDQGQTTSFSYQSLYQPMMDKDVYCQAIDSANFAIGKTIGMGTTIPEPGSIVAMSFGILGLIPMVRRRRA